MAPSTNAVYIAADAVVSFATPQLQGFLEHAIAAWMSLTGEGQDPLGAQLTQIEFELAFKELLEAHLEQLLADPALPHGEIETLRGYMRAIIRAEQTQPAIVIKKR